MLRDRGLCDWWLMCIYHWYILFYLYLFTLQRWMLIPSISERVPARAGKSLDARM